METPITRTLKDYKPGMILILKLITRMVLIKIFPGTIIRLRKACNFFKISPIFTMNLLITLKTSTEKLFFSFL